MAHDDENSTTSEHLSVAVATTGAGRGSGLISLTSRGNDFFFHSVVLVLGGGSRRTGAPPGCLPQGGRRPGPRRRRIGRQRAHPVRAGRLEAAPEARADRKPERARPVQLRAHDRHVRREDRRRSTVRSGRLPALHDHHQRKSLVPRRRKPTRAFAPALLRQAGIPRDRAVFLVAPSRHSREDVRSKLCVSCSCTLENDTDKQTNGQHYTAADRRQTNQVSAWQAGRGSHRTRLVTDLLRTSSRGCHEDATRKTVPWNLSRAVQPTPDEFDRNMGR